MNADASADKTSLPEAGGKRIAILRAAARLFSRRGYNETSMKDVAEAAGIAVGTIYLYYRNKEDLLTGIYRHSSALLLERLTKRIEGRTDPVAKYAIYIEDSIDYAFEHPDFFLIIFVDLRRKEIELPKRPAFSNFRRFLALGESIIEEGQARGQFPGSLPAARLNLGIVSMWAGLVLTMVLEPAVKAGSDDRRQVKDLVLSSVLEGILTPPARPAPRPGPDGSPKRMEGQPRRDD
ncbi:MAG: TetR family transcriptional regulator [Acidobacteriota bacterium]